MDHKTGRAKKVEAGEEAVRRISSNLPSEILDLSEGDNITELCSEEKIKKAYPPRESAEIPAIASVDMAEFMSAAGQGNVDVIDKYLSESGNPNVHDELKRTALHRAAVEGHVEIVQMLLEKGADINLEDQLGSRAVHWACRGGSLSVVEALKNHGADLNARDKLCSTPLHVATRTGHADIVEYLLSCGAKINLRDREGDTALHDAVRLNRFKIVEQLVASGADTKIKNHEGVTAVQQVKQWQSDIMEILQRGGKLSEVGVMPPENTSADK